MATPQHDSDKFSHQLTTALVLRVEERTCEIVDDSGVRLVRFASAFPSPRRERVSPGHLVAVAAGPQGGEAVVWRWYDAVVLGPEGDDSVRLWEPAHGEVVAHARTSYKQQPPGSRATRHSGMPRPSSLLRSGLAVPRSPVPRAPAWRRAQPQQQQGPPPHARGMPGWGDDGGTWQQDGRRAWGFP